ncbi:asparagine synthase [Moesziomyces antarcticus T-34]|uniref:Asparagine synthase n=1 Tax=Pseudozyma antarctica (strain T-34) TaxID=1151754 RepID=M9LN42_PSEA3|nr:asparagine synthase [Moesziomyces antarcticus T-34]
MCGIGIAIAPASSAHDHVWPTVLDAIRRRGPDSLRTLHHRFTAHSQPYALSLASSVLSLRGVGITAQPLASTDGRLLLAWNGQIFDTVDGASSSRVRLDAGENDAQVLLDRITTLVDAGSGCEQAVNAALAEVEAPYALALLDTHTSTLVFARDPLGRRSLLLHRSPRHEALTICSVASTALLDSIANDPGATLDEIDCATIWAIDLLRSPTTPRALPRCQSRFTQPLLLRELRPQQPASTDDDFEAARDGFLAVLADSVQRRVANIATDQAAGEAHVAVLFSGGLDCTTLALLAHRYVPAHQPIDLLNVGFENPRALAAARTERQRKARASTDPRRRNKHQPASTPLQDDAAESAPELGGEEDIYAVPDRLTGLASYEELRRLAPLRRWNFVAINIAYDEYTRYRAQVATLMAPTSSVMDLSIGCALYFASRGAGLLGSELYTTPARVLLSGLGADELLGGYSRHRQALSSGLCALVDELQLDLHRLPTRNLGRDDRVISTHAREARYPFLDRTVLDYLTSTPTTTKINTDLLKAGQRGDKFLLRKLAQSLGLVQASRLQKRAMQFGTRAAKIDPHSGAIKGHHKA